jgi:hypothetical protein
MHVVETYKQSAGTAYRVLVARISSPNQVLQAGAGSIHHALESECLGNSVGLYFYRFHTLKAPEAFTKIGEVSRQGGVIVRKKRGWLAPQSYGDSYLKGSTTGAQKGVHSDVLGVTDTDPMYFVFYQFDVENSFPKIDEMAAFAKHVQHFGRSTRNREPANTFSSLGRNLIWHPNAFEEVLKMQLPSGRTYSEAI